MIKPISSIADRWKNVPLAAGAMALFLLLVGVAIILKTAADYDRQRRAETEVQVRILAANVVAALDFNDARTAQETVSALALNPQVRAAGVYDQNGKLFAGYSRSAGALPPQVGKGTSGQGNLLESTAPVERAGEIIGSAYLQAVGEPFARRVARYSILGLFAFFAALIVLVLGVAQSALRKANRELATRADELGTANSLLQVQMAEREKAEEALRQSQKMEAMGQLTGGVAHDFNNLLMVASGGLDLLDRTDDPARRERLKSGIRQAIDRGAKLTQQLLTFARKSPLKPEVLDVERTLRGLEDLFERSLREDIEVQMHFEPDLRPIEVDRSQFEVAVLNVAINARDAMPEGGVIRIEATTVPATDTEPAMICVAVVDQGTGISQENLQKVFEPFFTTKGVGHGTGLGLSQVYGFARAAGGDIRFESELGKGSTVSFLLPCSDKELPAVAPPASISSNVQHTSRILLVEDDDQVTALVGEMVHELGYTFVRVADATEALEQLEHSDAFDLVFTDMVMPGIMGGLELAHEVGRRWPDVKVVLTSGYSQAAALALAEGRDILAKPYTMETLREKLSVSLAKGARADL